MLFDLSLLLAGLVLLIGASEVVVKKAQTLARRLRISELVIGLTVLAFGSDIPEMATNINAGLGVRAGNPISGIAIGNVLGSTLSQITLIAGIVAAIATVYIDKRALRRDGTIMLGAFVLMLLASIDGRISALEGLFLCLVYIIYIITLGRFLVKAAISDKTPLPIKKFLHFLHVRPVHEVDIAEELKSEEVPSPAKAHLVIADVAILAVGIAAVVIAAHFMINASTSLAATLGISPLLIGLILGLGTSLPELTISITAIRKGASGISIGNLIGANIVDPTFSLGLGALASGVGFTVETKVLTFEFPFLFVGTIMALLMLHDHDDLDRSEAWTLILFYCLFIFLSIVMLSNGCRV
jgi:cation:H+ antiporter